MKTFIKVHNQDNVLVALKDLKAGETLEIDGAVVQVRMDIPKGHKVAIKKISKDGDVIKYGLPIGYSLEDIEAGDHVHVHNTKTKLSGTIEYAFDQKLVDRDITKDNRVFMGYKRENGSVGIRNELWIVPTVGCVNGIGQMIVDIFKNEVDIRLIDNIEVYKHNYGCSQLGDDHENTKRILSGMVNHPNCGGALVLGLGCENNQVAEFKEFLGNIDENRVKFLVTQEVEDEVEEGVRLVREIFEAMKGDTREEVPLSELKVGLKCGGSDGLSGITANPLLGNFSDYLIAQGGTSVLTEVPEMFGAETILMERAKNKEIFEKIVHLINDFKEYFLANNQPVYENPSPGNKKGGITTLEDKSLGCTQKAGHSKVVDVLKYGEILKEKGLNLLSAPGNDLVASTALAASGCHMVLFTTGRGTPFGTFVPTIKISSNSEIYYKKKNWIDFNAGILVEDKSMEEVLEEFIHYIVEVASGKLANNEKNEFREIAIFKTGVTL
ncbi:altronate hydrolase [Anaerosolibacter carboniphilus]|uniref:Altronate hydrolase n=1 Tax=Anaerosolibacter carboniphilus TaxID=1417629 RepID=A0A841L2V0_9FIRM|nr:altronate dehydratase family protein [Anaerosolibacter carboniphilus]MBB6218500.1 altronate hydrolase [Anaerosolibacter carboniphilus]